MSQIAFVGSAAAVGTYSSPGPTITYSSVLNNTLVISGSVKGVAGGTPLSSSAGITAITDSAGNAWQFS